jgi:hypothetical protein
MDPADATSVALAERRDERKIVTGDRDFYVYRLNGRRRFVGATRSRGQRRLTTDRRWST